MTSYPISRRQLFWGDLRGKAAPIRPPWSIPETLFTAACDRCGDCLEACPEQIIRLGDGGYPLVDFSLGGCTFCTECVTACDSRAPRGDPEREPPWALTARIDGACLALRSVICRSCFDACDAGAIRFHPRVGDVAKPTLSTTDCVGCGHCVRVCPTQAIKMETNMQQEAVIAPEDRPAS